ncbi:hypothetical protein WJX79_006229 [Trebouxia sp. C0005]
MELKINMRLETLSGEEANRDGDAINDMILQSFPGEAIQLLTRASGAASAAADFRPGIGQQSRWRSVIRWALRIFASVVFSAALLLAMLPGIMSTRRGRDRCFSLANMFVPGTVQVTDMQIGWQQPLDVSGLTWTEPQELGGRQLASVDRVNTSRALLDIVRGRPFDVMVSKPNVDCSIDVASGEMHITQVLQGTAQPAQALPAETLSHSSKGRTHSTRQLLVESSPLQFTAEGLLLNAHIYVSDGVLQVPDELRQVIGKDFHASAIVGGDNLNSDGADFGIETGWAQTEHQPKGTAHSGHLLEPTAVAFNSQHVQAQLSGWRTKTGMLLREPATAAVDYTPALAKYGLQRISPLMSNVVAVQEGGKVEMRWTPEHMALPAERSTLQIQPMKLVVGRGDFVSKIVNLLGLKDSSLSKSSLQAWTSTIAVDVYPGGPIQTQRLDILLGIGHGHTGVHLCMWGSMDPTQDSALDMTLGFPADTLTWAGLKGVPQDGMLTVVVRGTADKPKIDWQGAYNKLTSSALTWQTEAPAADGSVSFKQTIANKALKGLGTLHRRVIGSSSQVGQPGDATSAKVPQPVAPLPWQTKTT